MTGMACRFFGFWIAVALLVAWATGNHDWFFGVLAIRLALLLAGVVALLFECWRGQHNP